MTPHTGAPKTPGRWSDLRRRAVSAIVLGGLGIAAIWAGGLWFTAFTAAAVGTMVFELAGMLGSPVRRRLGFMAGGACLAVALLPAGWGLPFLMLPAIFGANEVARDRLPFALFTVLIVLAGYGLIHLRDDIGTLWLVWLVLIVVATDVFGYFAGRLIGGPKFWPQISPKKTWAGTVAGWIGAGGIGVAYVYWAGAQPQIIGISMAMSMAAQFGDIAESALKRRAGVKDSSNLIPGHGGFFDRFDGVLGAAVFLLLIERVAELPLIFGTG
ncbi:MAG: phosphatidate cytidylyltransferase [Rhodobacteraceae bacterium]|nr:phosphatidate cytidylyltransferase [Paracoccaceae bacterium]